MLQLERPDQLRVNNFAVSKLGIDAGVDVGAHKTSMLQDFEQGRPLELDALVASVSEMGRLVDVPTPTIDAMLALVQLRVSVDS